AVDPGVATSARETALRRAAREDLLPSRELGEALAMLSDTPLGGAIAATRDLPRASERFHTEIGRLLDSAKGDADAFLLTAKIFEDDIAALELSEGTRPFSAELALAALLTRKFDAAERFMQAVASEQTLGSDRAYLNLARLYAYLRPSAAQRLAGAIGEELGEVPSARLPIADPAARAIANPGVSEGVDDAITAARSGSIGSSLLVALTAAAVDAEGELELVRDAVATNLYAATPAADIAREAAFRREALAFAPRLREESFEEGAYVPRLKPAGTNR
ncbi:MAG: hypothetical protein V2I43_08655, partial [Parvularcula sp.]|nr:hypothetical protein [Parvularcula sp.]